MFRERFFLLTPTAIRPVANENAHGLYRDAEGLDMRWSAPFPIPRIGEFVRVRMNGIGMAKVKGYFDSGDPDQGYTYVGLMVKPSHPPAYYREQTRKAKNSPNAPKWQKEGIGCVFGIEISEQPTIRSAISAATSDR